MRVYIAKTAGNSTVITVQPEAYILLGTNLTKLGAAPPQTVNATIGPTNSYEFAISVVETNLPAPGNIVIAWKVVAPGQLGTAAIRFLNGDGAASHATLVQKLADAALDAAQITSGTLTRPVTNSAVQTTNLTVQGGVVVTQKTLSLVGTNVTLALSGNATFYLTLTTNAYFVQPTGLVAGQPFYVHLQQDATGGRTVGFDTNVWKFPSRQILTTTTNANAWSILSCLVGPNGTNVATIQTLNLQ